VKINKKYYYDLDKFADNIITNKYKKISTVVVIFNLRVTTFVDIKGFLGIFGINPHYIL